MSDENSYQQTREQPAQGTEGGPAREAPVQGTEGGPPYTAPRQDDGMEMG